MTREVQPLEKKVEDVSRVREERNVEASQKTGPALKERAKLSDREELAGDLAHLKENEKKTATKSPAAPSKPAPPAPGNRREFVYDSAKPLKGVIAHLTRECGGNVRDKGIVNVLGTDN